MNIQEIFTSLKDNPVISALAGLVKDMLPAGIMDWYFMGKLARRNADGTRKPNEFEDEKEYRRVAAILRDRLEREGQGEEILVDAMDALMATLSAQDAFTFRECIRLTQDENHKLLILLDVAKAPSDQVRLAKIKAINQQPTIIKWVVEDIVSAYRRYSDTLRPPTAPQTILDLLAFTNSLKASEHLQFKIAIGGFEDQAQRLAAIQEITALPQDQRLELARARGYISSSSPKHLTQAAVAHLSGALNSISTGAEGLAQRLEAHNNTIEAQQSAAPPQNLGATVLWALTGYRRR